MSLILLGFGGLCASGPAAAAVDGAFYVLPRAPLAEAQRTELEQHSKILFHFEDSLQLAFVDAASEKRLTEIFAGVAEQPQRVGGTATFRMVVDEWGRRKIREAGEATPALDPALLREAQVTISLAYFVRNLEAGETWHALDRAELESSPLADDLQHLNPLLFEAITSAEHKDIRRVLFHWEIEHGGAWKKIFLPDTGLQVSREVRIADGAS